MVARRLALRRTRMGGTPIRTNTPDIHPSGINATYETRLARTYGRSLQGYADPVQRGSEMVVRAQAQDTWGGADKALARAAVEDDNVGNGIFDGAGAPPVQHADNGIFEARYSEPGWLYRERLTRPGPGVDTNNGLPVVSMPAGGSWPGEMARAYRPWDDETPRLYGKQPPIRRMSAPVPSAVGSLGDDASGADTASLAEWAIGGLVAGAGAYVLYSLLRGK